MHFHFIFQFELVELKVISIFYEFGGGGAHYNFTAKQPEDQQNADADSTKLFFSEVDLYFRSENDVIMCCIVGENDAGTLLVFLTVVPIASFLILGMFPCCS